MAGYTRQSAAQIVDAGTIHADDFNNEYNQIEAAFDESTGHKHDGTAAEGALIPVIASSDGLNKAEANGTDNSIDFSVDVGSVATKQLSVVDGILQPTVTNDIDLGSLTYKFKDLHLAGAMNAASADVTGNITVGGTVDGRDVATDGTKLDSIEAGAEVNENSFQTITASATGTGVASGGNVVADTTTDTLNLVAGDDITLTNDPVTDTITIKATAGPTNAVVGPASATDNALPRYDGTTGKLVQDSGITVDDADNVAGAGIDLAANTVTGTLAEFNTAISDDDVFGKAAITGAIGNLSTPMVDLLRVNRLQGEHVGSLTVNSPAGTMYPDRYGVLQNSADGVPRFGKNGFICSPGATNYCIYSSDASSATQAGLASVTTDVVVAPDGTTTADTLTEDTSLGSHRIYQGTSIPSGFAAGYVHAEPGTCTKIRVLVYNPTDGAVAQANFDLTNGAVESTAFGSARITEVAQGFYECAVYGTATVANSTLYVDMLDDSYSASYTGTGRTVHVWGRQLSDVLTVHIPTTTAPVTVGAAYGLFPVAENMPDAGDPFSVVVEFEIFGTSTSLQYVYNAETTSDNSYIYFDADTFTLRAKHSSASFTEVLAKGSYRVALTFDGATTKLYVDGVLANSQATNGNLVVDTTGSIGVGSSSTESNFLNGSIRDFKIYYRALTADEVRIG